MTILELFNKKFKAKGDNMDKKIVLITGAGCGIKIRQSGEISGR